MNMTVFDRIKKSMSRNKSEDTASSAQSYQIGQLVEGEGVFIGEWTPEGVSQTFNLLQRLRILSWITAKTT